jgi:hypothetical protein
MPKWHPRESTEKAATALKLARSIAVQARTRATITSVGWSLLEAHVSRSSTPLIAKSVPKVGDRPNRSWRRKIKVFTDKVALAAAAIAENASAPNIRGFVCGAGPGEIRTHDLCLRRAALYPIHPQPYWSATSAAGHERVRRA